MHDIELTRRIKERGRLLEYNYWITLSSQFKAIIPLLTRVYYRFFQLSLLLNHQFLPLILAFCKIN